MGGITGSVNALKNEILKQAREQALNTVDRAKRVAERDIFYAREEAENAKAQERCKLSSLMEMERKKATAASELEARKMLLQKKAELVSRAFVEAQKKLEELRNFSEYKDMLARLIKEGIFAIDGDAIVEFSGNDKHIFTLEFLTSLRSQIIRSLGKGLHIQFECIENNISAGVIVKSRNGKMMIDNSFSGIFRRLKEELRSKVLEMLLLEEER